MRPVSPIFPNSILFETTYEGGNEIDSIPTMRNDTTLVTRWEMSQEERDFIANGGDLFILVKHFGHPLQAMLAVARSTDEVYKLFVEQAGH